MHADPDAGLHHHGGSRRTSASSPAIRRRRSRSAIEAALDAADRAASPQTAGHAAGRAAPSNIRLPRYDIDAFLIEVELLARLVSAVCEACGRPTAGARRFVALWREALAPALEAPPTWVLRDYHSPNLLWLPDAQDIGRIGVLDFQDAVMGPAAYDVASLLQDARVDVPEAHGVRAARPLRAARGRPTIGAFEARAFRAALCDACRAARHANPRHLRAARPARRQAAIPASHARAYGAICSARWRIRPWHRSRLVRHQRAGAVSGMMAREMAAMGDGCDQSTGDAESGDRAGGRVSARACARYNGNVPKPLVAVGGKSLIDHVLDRLADAGVERAVVNVHHLAEALERHLRRAPAPADRHFRRARHAARHRRRHRQGAAETRRCAVLPDQFRHDLDRRREAQFRAAGAMPSSPPRWTRCCCSRRPPAASAMQGGGDFAMLPDGRLRRRADAKWCRTSMRAPRSCRRALFADAPAGAFPLTLLFDRAGERGRLFGLRARRPVDACRHAGSGRRGRSGTRRRRCRILLGPFRGCGAALKCTVAPQRFKSSDARARLHHPGVGAVSADADRGLARRQAGLCPALRDPLALASATLYLPTRRACRLARDAFLDVLRGRCGNSAAHRCASATSTRTRSLSPKRRPASIAADALALPQALGGLERRLLLTQLIVKWANSPELHGQSGAPLVAQTPAAACALADDLARLIDDMTTRDVPWKRLDNLVPGQFRRILATDVEVS